MVGNKILQKDLLLTCAILAVPVMHHAETLEAPPGSLVRAADPLDAGVPPFLQHVLRAFCTLTVPFSPKIT